MSLNIDEILNDMSVEEKVGQLFLLAFSGNRLDEARVLMERHLVGAAYISNDNIPNPAAAYDLATQLQSFASNTRLQLPLLLGVDQEGAWSVMTDGSVMGPGNMALGATHTPDAAYRMYEVIGKELAAVGLNMLLAPCADCNSNPDNSIIGMRSFGEYPEQVAAMTAAAVKGTLAGGVLATVKHYPGHGDTTLDSHRGLPSVTRSGDELRTIDLQPFQAGIDAGVPIVMTAHILFSALDANNPATLSKTILEDVLRGEMGFEGVILSDSMNMHSMKKNYDPHDSAVRAILAGVDLLMLAEEHYDHDAAQYLNQQQALIAAVIAAVRDGMLPMARVDEAVQRVLTLKAQVVDKQELERDEALSIVGSDAHRQVELDVSRQAVAVLHNENNLVPLPDNQPLVLINTTLGSSYEVLGNTRGIGPNQTTPAFDSFAAAIAQKRNVLQVIPAEDMLGERTPTMPDGAIIVLVTENYPLPGIDFQQTSQQKIIKQLVNQAANRLVVVALRDPYELDTLPSIPTYVCAFSFRPCAAQAMSDVLCGLVPAGGKSPVSVPAMG